MGNPFRPVGRAEPEVCPAASRLLPGAGGLGPAGTTFFTVDARTGRFTAGPEVQVQAGDAVFVDRPPTSDSPQFESLALQQENIRLQEERSERDAERDRRQFLLQTITTTISTVGFLISTYFLIRDNAN